jgi:HEAT repeat protein
LALGDLGDKRAVEPLLATLKNNDSDSVRTGVVVSLGVIGDKRAIEPLEKLLKTEKNESVRQQIEYALQRLNGNQSDKQ